MLKYSSIRFLRPRLGSRHSLLHSPVMVPLSLLYLIVASGLAVAKKDSRRGLTFPSTDNPEDVLNINQTQSVISWIYDWALSPPSYLVNTSVEYVPMQWGADNIENLASAVKNQSAKTLLVRCLWTLVASSCLISDDRRRLMSRTLISNRI